MNFLAILICLAIERFTSAGKKTREFHCCEYYLRFAHALKYIEQLADENNLEIVSKAKQETRKQNNTPSEGHLFLLKNSG